MTAPRSRLEWAALEALAAMKAADRVAEEEDDHPDRDNPATCLTPMQSIRFQLLYGIDALESALRKTSGGGA